MDEMKAQNDLIDFNNGLNLSGVEKSIIHRQKNQQRVGNERRAPKRS